MRTWVAALLILCACRSSTGPDLDGHATSLADFERRLDILRGELDVPGMSVGISEGNHIVWSRGLGHADIERGIAASPTTDFHIASLTKGFAAIILVKLASTGTISLDDPVKKFGVNIAGDAGITVRHLATMTSEGTPGRSFAYNGDRYALLEQVITSATGKSLAENVVEGIIKPLSLSRTAPNVGSTAFNASGLDRAAFTANLATGYQSSKPIAYPTLFSPAAGLISTAEDLLNYSIAIDGGTVLTPAERSLMFQAATSTSGGTLPYAIGWFSQTIDGVAVQWSYGYWTGNSALIIRVPSKQRTFVALANSDGLSSSFPLGAGNLLSSPIAREFLEAFIFGDTPLS
jgi:CubicO group peptidase (beta-lactamase class C family)